MNPPPEGIERLHCYPPQPWISTPVTSKLFTELCWVSTTHRRFTHHHGTGASLGHGAGNGSAVRRFAVWHNAMDPRTEIPPEGILCERYRRKAPYIYSDEEIDRLLRRTQRLPSSKGLRANTFTTLFGLLVVTGMRVNEALNLDRQDVDLDLGILHIRAEVRALNGLSAA